MEKEQNNKQKKYIKYKEIVINIFVCILSVVALYIIARLLSFASQNIATSLFGDSSKMGEIGDSAGLLNAIFSGLAFLGVIITVFLQSKELKQTTTELKNQKEEFQIQNQTLKRQQFENTFFNMLKTQNNITYNLEFGIEGYDSYRAGRRVFEKIYYLLKNKIQKEQKIFCEEDKKLREEIIKIYDSIYCVKNLDHYFRHMYRIVKFVKETDFSFCLADEEDKNKTKEEKIKKIKHEKYQYTSILRATLSPYELVLLFYNCLNEENKFRPLIEEYCLLQNIRSEFLKKETFGFYEKSAYGNKYEDIKQELEKKV